VRFDQDAGTKVVPLRRLVAEDVSSPVAAPGRRC
jgi:hypothetical protein